MHKIPLSSNVTLVIGGDIFNSDCQTLVNPVNCVGVMGKGLSLLFKERFPDTEAPYKQACRSGELNNWYPFLDRRQNGKWILHFATKTHYRESSKISDIVTGLTMLNMEHKFGGRYDGVQSLAFPALGTGLGGLPWVEVFPVMFNQLRVLKVPVEIYAPINIIA